MKRLFWKIFYFIFKPMLPALLVSYHLRIIAFPILIYLGIYILNIGLHKNNHFLIFIASIIWLLVILLFILTIFMNKDKYLMKIRKGVIINENPYNDFTYNDNLLNDENYSDEEAEDDNDDDEGNDKEDEEDDNNYKDINNERMLYVCLLELISDFWIWVLFYGIYTYYVNKDWYPFKIAFIMFVVNIICNFIIKKHKK